MAKNHLMSWLLANHQVHGSQFIALGKDLQHLENVMRIDNEIEWPLMGYDRLDISYRSPFLWDVRNGGYAVKVGMKLLGSATVR